MVWPSCWSSGIVIWRSSHSAACADGEQGARRCPVIGTDALPAQARRSGDAGGGRGGDGLGRDLGVRVQGAEGIGTLGELLLHGISP